MRVWIGLYLGHFTYKTIAPLPTHTEFSHFLWWYRYLTFEELIDVRPIAIFAFYVGVAIYYVLGLVYK